MLLFKKKQKKIVEQSASLHFNCEGAKEKGEVGEGELDYRKHYDLMKFPFNLKCWKRCNVVTHGKKQHVYIAHISYCASCNEMHYNS